MKDLSQRVAFLLALLSGQRCQTIGKLSIDNMTMEETKITFLIADKLKHSGPGVHQQPLVFMAYVADQKLCILTYLQEYLKRTSPVRGDNKQPLISFAETLYKPISTETISHWIKNFMTTAGVDTTQYKSPSTRAASTSHLASQQFDLKDILNAAGWSKEETFKRFYHFKDNNEFNFGSAIMNTLS
ncbi:Pro-Pol poly [Paramuricea clavata]|uniref:Pro-Pol poly n=1 Tax=Paramuricea clavata TaxID=317549 RepID=A0A7D9E1B5_PARCT|nr:Pro-Pol poly [Paramuricea clavata]